MNEKLIEEIDIKEYLMWRYYFELIKDYQYSCISFQRIAVGNIFRRKNCKITLIRDMFFIETEFRILKIY